MVDLLAVGALGVVSLEWLLLGWLSRLDWPDETPSPNFWAARWALRLLVGACLCAMAQLLLAMVGLGFSSMPVVMLVAAGAAWLVRLVARTPTARRPSRVAWVTRRELVGWLVLGGLLVAALVRALVVPEAGWDAYSHWGLRAQAFALAGTIVNAHSEHEYYPPLVPLLEAWVYLQRGLVSIDLGKTVWAVVGGAFGICLAWHLRLSLAIPWLAPLVAAAILLSTPALLDGFWTGQADLALTAWLSLATLAVLQWQRSADRAWLIHAALFGAAATLTKFEGFPRIAVLVAAVLAQAFLCRSKRHLGPALVLGLAASLAFAAWTTFQLTHGIPANAEHLGQLQPLALGGVLLSLLAVFGGIRTGGGILMALVAWALAARQLPGLLVLVVIGELAATLLAFLVSASAPDIEVRTSATRLFEQFVPLAMFAGAVGLTSYISTYNRRGR